MKDELKAVAAPVFCIQFILHPSSVIRSKNAASIRRSLTLYLFALLAVTLAVVWFVIDQMMARALAAQQGAGADLIRARYEERSREERARVDKVLLDQATALGGVLQTYYYTQYETEVAKSRAAIGVVPLAFGPAPLSSIRWLKWPGHPLVTTAESPGNRTPTWALFRTYFANPRSRTR